MEAIAQYSATVIQGDPARLRALQPRPPAGAADLLAIDFSPAGGYLPQEHFAQGQPSA